MGISGKVKRNEIHGKLKKLLWYGNTAGALKLLNGLSADYIKSADYISDLKKYIERNLDTIPCYMLRKGLGLRNSSNLVEKANDRVVSSRQKHNGMAWSTGGSFGLASVGVTQINKEMKAWLHDGIVKFTFDGSKTENSEAA